MSTSVLGADAGVRGADSRTQAKRRKIELHVFALVLVVLNWPLFCGGTTDHLAFEAEAFRAGQWWRALTHPFVHVSWYHFFLDAVAFLILYHGLLTERIWQRLGCVAASAGGSLLVAFWSSPVLILSHGLRGLSGIAHGILIFSMLEVWAGKCADPKMRAFGALGAGAVTVKVLWEMFVGTALFETFHFGLLGVPVVASHAGGVIGALLFWSGISLGKRPSMNSSMS